MVPKFVLLTSLILTLVAVVSATDCSLAASAGSPFVCSSDTNYNFTDCSMPLFVSIPSYSVNVSLRLLRGVFGGTITVDAPTEGTLIDIVSLSGIPSGILVKITDHTYHGNNVSVAHVSMFLSFANLSTVGCLLVANFTHFVTSQIVISNVVASGLRGSLFLIERSASMKDCSVDVSNCSSLSSAYANSFITLFGNHSNTSVRFFGVAIVASDGTFLILGESAFVNDTIVSVSQSYFESAANIVLVENVTLMSRFAMIANGIVTKNTSRPLSIMGIGTLDASSVVAVHSFFSLCWACIRVVDSQHVSRLVLVVANTTLGSLRTGVLLGASGDHRMRMAVNMTLLNVTLIQEDPLVPLYTDGAFQLLFLNADFVDTNVALVNCSFVVTTQSSMLLFYVGQVINFSVVVLDCVNFSSVGIEYADVVKGFDVTIDSTQLYNVSDAGQGAHIVDVADAQSVTLSIRDSSMRSSAGMIIATNVSTLSTFFVLVTIVNLVQMDPYLDPSGSSPFQCQSRGATVILVATNSLFASPIVLIGPSRCLIFIDNVLSTFMSVLELRELEMGERTAPSGAPISSQKLNDERGQLLLPLLLLQRNADQFSAMLRTNVSFAIGLHNVKVVSCCTMLVFSDIYYPLGVVSVLLTGDLAFIHAQPSVTLHRIICSMSNVTFGFVSVMFANGTANMSISWDAVTSFFRVVNSSILALPDLENSIHVSQPQSRLLFVYVSNFSISSLSYLVLASQTVFVSNESAVVPRDGSIPDLLLHVVQSNSTFLQETGLSSPVQTRFFVAFGGYLNLSHGVETFLESSSVEVFAVAALSSSTVAPPMFSVRVSILACSLLITELLLSLEQMREVGPSSVSVAVSIKASRVVAIGQTAFAVLPLSRGINVTYLFATMFIEMTNVSVGKIPRSTSLAWVLLGGALEATLLTVNISITNKSVLQQITPCAVETAQCPNITVLVATGSEVRGINVTLLSVRTVSSATLNLVTCRLLIEQGAVVSVTDVLYLELASSTISGPDAVVFTVTDSFVFWSRVALHVLSLSPPGCPVNRINVQLSNCTYESTHMPTFSIAFFRVVIVDLFVEVTNFVTNRSSTVVQPVALDASIVWLEHVNCRQASLAFRGNLALEGLFFWSNAP